MLTNPIEGVSDDSSAEDLFAKMDELESGAPQEEAAEYEQPEDDEAEYQASEPEQDELDEVEWGGKKYKIPRDLKPGLMMQSDYTKKTQALSEQRKALEEQAQAAKQEREYYANQLSGFVKQLGQQIQQMPTEEQILEVSKTDPIAAMRMKSERDIKIAQLNQAQQNEYKIRQQQEAERQRSMAEYLETQRATLMDKVPEWKDEAKRNSEMSGIVEYAQNLGYSQQELSELYDHRAYLVLRDAMRYRQLMNKPKTDAKQQAQAPKVIKPGASVPTDGKKLPDALVKNFKKAPTVENAAAIFEKLG